jgi:FkbM family methyltransferase
VQLVRIRLRAGRHSTHTLRIPKRPQPITILGGQSADAWALHELLAMQAYAFVSNLNSPAFIIDGGANMGLASSYVLNHAAARIFAVETSPANFEILRKNLATYADRVTLIQGAIWKNRGRLHLELRPEEWQARVRAGDGDQPGSVEAFTVPAPNELHKHRYVVVCRNLRAPTADRTLTPVQG